MPEQKFDFSVFTHPQILFTERFLAAGSDPVATDYNDLKASRDFLIDWICIGDDGNYGTSFDINASNLQHLEVNWQIADRAPVFPAGLVPAAAFQTWWDCDRTQLPTLSSGFYPNSVFFWRHVLRWVFNPSQSFRIDYEMPTPTNTQSFSDANVVKDIAVGIHAVGLRTGHRRVFGTGGTLNVSPQPGQPPVTGSLVAPNFTGNIADEPYLVEGIGWLFNDTWQQAAPAGPGDTRWFSYLRLKFVPTQGQPWSDVPVPLWMYGVHQGPPQRSIWYKPPGGPILMKAGQSMIFQLRNEGTVPSQNMRAQIGLIGRVAPGYGSLY